MFDPLAGGGTTLFTALTLGAQTVAGVEQDAKNGKSTTTFLKQFANEYHIPVRLKEERLKKLGRCWTVSLGKAPELSTARGLMHSRVDAVSMMVKLKHMSQMRILAVRNAMQRISNPSSGLTVIHPNHVIY